MTRGKKWKDGTVVTRTKISKEIKANRDYLKRFKKEKSDLTAHELDDELNLFTGGARFRQDTQD